MRADYPKAARASIPSRRRCARAPLALAVALCLAARGHAATITVNDARGDVANPADVTCSLADAIAALNTAAVFGGCAAGDGSNDRIVFTFGTATTIQFLLPTPGDNNSALHIAKPVSIVGAVDANQNPLITLKRSSANGTPNFRLIATTGNLSLSGLALTNGNVAESGGAVRATGYATVSLANSSVSANTASVSGGGVATDCGALSLSHSTVSGNGASKNGGGVYVSDYLKTGVNQTCPTPANIAITQSTLSTNTVAVGSGGGAFNFNGGAALQSSTISGNTVAANGGGVYAYGSVTIANSTVSNNAAHTGDGGGVWSYAISGNTAVVGGNSAPAGQGGGIFTYSADLDSSTITTNAAQCGGGGLHAHNAARLVASTVSLNTSGNSECANTSGGLFALGNVTLVNSTFNGNFGGQNGYGAVGTRSNLQMYFNTIVGNTAMAVNDRAGGVAFFGSATLYGNIVSGNSSNDIYTAPVKTVNGAYNIITRSAYTTLPGDTNRTCTPNAGLYLGALANNGGPTLTMALLTGSCAIGAGPDYTPLPGNVTTDERGEARPTNKAVDIGAFQIVPDKIFANGFES